MWKHLGRLALVGGLGLAAFIISDALIPDVAMPEALGNGEPVEPEVVDVTPEA